METSAETPAGAWQAAPSPYPAMAYAPTAPPPPRPAPRPQSRLREIAGGAGAALLALLKYGAILLKVGKFGPMLLSMAVSVWVFTQLYGWRFAVGIVGLILVHELGHVLFAKLEGVPTSLPFFLGPFGALIRLKGRVRDARQEAVIAIGGPLVGTAGALLCAGLAAAAPPGTFHLLLLALAWFGFLINLFNLTPMLPFDGGRVVGAVSIWLNLVGVAVMGGLIIWTARVGAGVNPFIVVLFILGCVTTVQRFRTRRSAYLTNVAPRTRLLIGGSWLGLIVVTAVGMSVAHRQLVDAQVLDPVSTGERPLLTYTPPPVHTPVGPPSSDPATLSVDGSELDAAVAATSFACQAQGGAGCDAALARATTAASRLADDLAAPDHRDHLSNASRAELTGQVDTVLVSLEAASRDLAAGDLQAASTELSRAFRADGVAAEIIWQTTA